ncbi:MAG: zinc ribbon domain-containing protein [Nanoarchaeota archaeon]|nr:zinc ribbon domain-containing protein [Nanoarchaeota archaeon]
MGFFDDVRENVAYRLKRKAKDTISDKVTDSVSKGVKKVVSKDSSPKCPKCRKKFEGEPKFCPSCGAKLVKTCKDCNADYPLSTKFCEHCGKPLR